MSFDVLGPLMLYVAGGVLIGSLLLKMAFDRLGRPSAGATAVLVGLCACVGLTLVGLGLIVIGP